MEEIFYVKLNKLITEHRLTLNDVYAVVGYLNRRYIDMLVKSNMEQVINNMGPYIKPRNDPKASEVVDALFSVKKDDSEATTDALRAECKPVQ